MLAYLRIETIAFLAATAVSVATVAPAVRVQSERIATRGLDGPPFFVAGLYTIFLIVVPIALGAAPVCA